MNQPGLGHYQMRMQQIRYFLALCDELNFTRAARRCGISQPSLTTAIRALEKDLGVTLFERRPRIALTEAGAAIRPYLARIVRHLEVAREAALLLGEPGEPQIGQPPHALACGAPATRARLTRSRRRSRGSDSDCA